MNAFQRFLSECAIVSSGAQDAVCGKNAGTILPEAIHAGTIDNQNAHHTVSMRRGLALR
jgi:hypothetical protein